MDRPDLLAERIAQLAGGTHDLESASLAALDFARAHTFEKTFARRVHQLGRLSRVKPALTRLLASHLEFA